MHTCDSSPLSLSVSSSRDAQARLSTSGSARRSDDTRTLSFLLFFCFPCVLCFLADRYRSVLYSTLGTCPCTHMLWLCMTVVQGLSVSIHVKKVGASEGNAAGPCVSRTAERRKRHSTFVTTPNPAMVPNRKERRKKKKKSGTVG